MVGRVDGAAELIADLNAAAHQIAGRLGPVIEDTVERIGVRSKATSHSRQVAAATTHEMTGPLTAVVGPEKRDGGWIAPFVERGTAKQPPHPSLLPAADEAEPVFHRGVLDELDKLL